MVFKPSKASVGIEGIDAVPSDGGFDTPTNETLLAGIKYPVVVLYFLGSPSIETFRFLAKIFSVSSLLHLFRF